MKIRWLFLVTLSFPLFAFSFTWSSVLQWVISLNNDNSAWSVTTKQTALTSNQIASNDVRATSMLSIAIGSLNQTERQKKNIIDYSASFGQPESNLCLAISQLNSFVKNMEAQKKDLRGRMASYGNDIQTSKVELNQSLQILHQDFCSVSESKQGLCKLKANGMQAWDVDYSGFTSQNNIEGTSEIGAIAYVKRISPSIISSKNQCKTNLCTDVRIQNLTNVARASMITNTFLSQVSIRKNSSL